MSCMSHIVQSECFYTILFYYENSMNNSLEWYSQAGEEKKNIRKNKKDKQTNQHHLHQNINTALINK